MYSFFGLIFFYLKMLSEMSFAKKKTYPQCLLRDLTDWTAYELKLLNHKIPLNILVKLGYLKYALIILVYTISSIKFIVFPNIA
jgi:DNA relaxase NicK